MTLVDILLGLAGIAVAGWASVGLLHYAIHRKRLYKPSGGDVDPVAAGLSGFAVSRLMQPDGITNVVWSAAAAPGQPTVLFFPGSGGGLHTCAAHYKAFQSEGWGVTAMSYRGYSGSGGTPSEKANVADALVTYDALRKAGLAAHDIVLFGESIGSSVAVQVAAERPVRAVVLESPFSSLGDMIQAKHPYVMLSWAVRDNYPSIKFAKHVSAPVLIMHGTLDRLVPISVSKKLFNALREPKRFVEYPKAAHIGLLQHGALRDIKAWVEATKV